MSDDQKVLICFDGSDGSARALTAAAKLFPGAHATITHVWQPPLPYGGIGYGGQIVLPADIQREIEVQAHAEAQKLADGAVHQAAGAGLDASAEVRETTGPIWRALLAAADDANADVIVAGSRGRGEVKALLLGSTSQALAHHSRRPLLIVPGGDDE